MIIPHTSYDYVIEFILIVDHVLTALLLVLNAAYRRVEEHFVRFLFQSSLNDTPVAVSSA
jgi:hypothetical protein